MTERQTRKIAAWSCPSPSHLVVLTVRQLGKLARCRSRNGRLEPTCERCASFVRRLGAQDASRAGCSTACPRERLPRSKCLDHVRRRGLAARISALPQGLLPVIAMPAKSKKQIAGKLNRAQAPQVQARSHASNAGEQDALLGRAPPGTSSLTRTLLLAQASPFTRSTSRPTTLALRFLPLVPCARQTRTT